MKYLLVFMLAFNTYSQNLDLINDIFRLSERIKRGSQQRSHDRVRLMNVRRKLIEAQRVLTGNGDVPTNYQRCKDFAFEKYDEVYTSTTAIDKARQLCQGRVYASTLILLYPYYRNSFTQQTSLSKAAQYARQDDVEFFYDQIKFIITQLDKVYTSQTAISKSWDYIGDIQNVTFSCLKSTFDRLSRSSSIQRSVEKSVEFCSQE